ncbi:MAG: hypothetical protein JW955_20340 [Sedimentisphaerales bacterium]|nr:hypothetical protein [Sedimentisphaerales bacterium]
MESRRAFAMIVAVTAGILLAGFPTGGGAAAELKATNPVPADGATGVTLPLLRWTPGATAVFHDVYVGTNPQPGPAELRGRRSAVTSMYFYPEALTPATTYYWRIDEIEADMTTIHTGDVWSFTTLGYAASNPSPADGATGVDPNVKLTWSPGSGAIAHNVYLGLDETLIVQGAGDTFKGNQAAPEYDPGTLSLGTTYYWRVDEVVRSRPPGGVIRGPVWSFTTREGPRPSVYCVDGKRGNDNNDGLSLNTAFAAIQKGIDAATDGDTVLVYPGVYRQPINFLGKAITVRSAEDAAVLAVGAEFAVSFYSDEGPDSVLENFVIRDSFLGLFLVGSSPTIRNLTVVGNKYGLEAYAQAAPDVVNCIFWYNIGDDLFESQARYSCIQRQTPGTGDFSSDPLFVDPNGRDFHLRSERGRYWPKHDVWVLDKVTSLCINAGDPQSDHSKEPKPNGGRINLGAYGGTAYASLSEGGQAGNQPPTVAITSPVDTTVFSSLPKTMRTEAEASDVDGLVVKVEFFANGEKIGEDTNSSDGWAMDWTPDALGLLLGVELVARATDDDGASTDSLSVSVRRMPVPKR